MLVDIATHSKHAKGFTIPRREWVLSTLGIDDAPDGLKAGIDAQFHNQCMFFSFITDSANRLAALGVEAM